MKRPRNSNSKLRTLARGKPRAAGRVSTRTAGAIKRPVSVPAKRPAQASARSPREARIIRRLDETERLLRERTAVLTQICDSPYWLTVRILGATRRIAIDPGNSETRNRELNEIAAVVNFALKPGIVFGYETRGWSLIRAMGAIRRMLGRGVLCGGWATERAELMKAIRELARGS